MATAINRCVQGRKPPVRTLQETREALEPFLTRLAADRRSEDDLRELQALHTQLVASVDNFQEFALLNIRWHNAVAKASGNELLSAVLYSVSHGLQVATTVEEYDTMETRRQVIHIHAKINESIVTRNPDQPERSMRQHLGATHSRQLDIGTDDIPLSDEVPPDKAPPARTTQRTAT